MTTDRSKPSESWSVTVQPAQLNLTGGTARVQLRQDPWKEWLTIAIDQCRLASKARQMELSNVAVEGDPPLRREYHATMIALTACAHAIDGFYIEVRAISGCTVVSKDRRRHVIVRKTLQSLFSDPGIETGRWKHDLAWLYADMRDTLVHPAQMTNEDIGLHPLGFGTSPEIAKYTVEAARRAVEFTLRLIEACLLTPRADFPGLIAFCESKSSLMERLRQRNDLAD